jgi:hypothetical protein
MLWNTEVSGSTARGLLLLNGCVPYSLLNLLTEVSICKYCNINTFLKEIK